MPKQPQTMTEAEWRALGERLFGADITKWAFKCPTCGHVMSYEKGAAMSLEQRQCLNDGKYSVESECIGRHIEDIGCNWCAYGLFSGPFFVVRSDGHRTPVFGFDMQETG